MRKVYLFTTLVSVALASCSTMDDPQGYGFFFSLLASFALGIIPVALIAQLFRWISGEKTTDKKEERPGEWDSGLVAWCVVTLIVGIAIKSCIFK